jgi:hypothetical protein
VPNPSTSRAPFLDSTGARRRFSRNPRVNGRQQGSNGAGRRWKLLAFAERSEQPI